MTNDDAVIQILQRYHPSEEWSSIWVRWDRNRHKFNPSLSSLRTYISMLARCERVEDYRKSPEYKSKKHTGKKVMYLGIDLPSSSVTNEDPCGFDYSLIESLTPCLARVTHLYARGLTLSQIRATLGIPLGTVKSQLSRSMGSLRSKLSARSSGQEPTTPMPRNSSVGTRSMFTGSRSRTGCPPTRPLHPLQSAA